MRNHVVLGILAVYWALALPGWAPRAHAQGEMANWFFGDDQAVGFQCGEPRAMAGNFTVPGFFNSQTSAISDSAGNLLFYMTPSSIYTANKTPMPGGELISGTVGLFENSLVLPQPGAPNSFYAFALVSDVEPFTYRLIYRRVDMALNDGLGAVVETRTVLDNRHGGYILAATATASEDTVWLITQDTSPAPDDALFLLAYPLTETGLGSPVPSFGPLNMGSVLKAGFNAQGNRLVLFNSSTAGDIWWRGLSLWSFDVATGEAAWQKGFGENLPYNVGGLTFEADGQHVLVNSSNYIDEPAGFTVPAYIYRYDVSLPNPDDSETLVLTLDDAEIGDLQVGPDGNIYFLRHFNPFLGVLRPAPGSATGYTADPEVLDLGLFLNSYNLPNFPAYFRRRIAQWNPPSYSNVGGPNYVVCPEGEAVLGANIPDSLGAFSWFPYTGLSNPFVANPVFTAPEGVTSGQQFVYTVGFSSEGCTWTDEVVVTVNPLPAPFAGRIAGSTSVCPGVEAVDYWLADSSEVGGTAWQVVGGEIVAQASPYHIRVSWGQTNLNAAVSVQRIDNATGCYSLPISLPVRIEHVLQPPAPVGDTLVCHLNAQGQAYSVPNTNGSVYTWFVQGGVVASGQGTPTVLIAWQGLGEHRLWLQEESTTIDTVCAGYSDTLAVTVYEDLSFMALDYVGWQEADSNTLVVGWQGQETLPGTLDQLGLVFRPLESNQQQGQLGVPGLTGMLSQTLSQPKDTVYTVWPAAVNLRCDTLQQWPYHQPVWLYRAEAANDNEASVAFTPYVGWQGVRYELWQKVDSSAWALQGSYSQAGEVAGINATQGFRHGFRVKAIRLADGRASWSNPRYISFEHPLLVPNAFSPNGDGFNDTYVVRNLGLRPGARLRVLNRWGKLVYGSEDYRNNWDGDGLPAGVYFYLLEVPGEGQWQGILNLLR